MFLIKRNRSATNDNNDPEIQELIQRVRQEEPISKELKDLLFNKFYYLVKKISKRYIYMHPTRFMEDIVGEANLAFIRTLDNIKERLQNHNNIIGCIAAVIHGQIANFLKKEFKEEAKKIIFRKRKTITTRELTKQNYNEINYNEINYPKFVKITECIMDDTKLIELREIIDMSITNPREKVIMKLKLEGYNDSEIARQLNCTSEWIRVNIRRVANRIRRLLEK